MEPILLFVLLLVFIAISVPIGVSLGLATLITMLLTSDIPVVMITQNAFAALDSFPLLAIPFFILAGNLMSLGGISSRIVEFANSLIGSVTGGLGTVTVIACMFFAAISGSGPATVSAIGAMMIPEMEKGGYSRGYATGLTAVAGTIGVIIPPSIPFVIFGVITGASIGELFLAGFIPGIMIGTALIFVNYFLSGRYGYRGAELPEGHRRSTKTVAKTFLSSFWALLTPVIVLGGIYGGIFTPTESAVIATVYSLVVGKFVYKELNMKILIDSVKETAAMTGITLFTIGLSMSFASYLTMEQIPMRIAAFIISLTDSKIMILLLINIFLLIVGCFVDNISSMIILTPVFLPIISQFGVDHIHFGIFMTVALAIGFVTPPYGANLFIASAVSRLKLEKIVPHAMPFLLAMLACLIVITYIPQISLFLPNLLYGR